MLAHVRSKSAAWGVLLSHDSVARWRPMLLVLGEHLSRASYEAMNLDVSMRKGPLIVCTYLLY